MKRKEKNNCHDVLSSQQTLRYVLEISSGPSQSICGDFWLLSYAASKPLNFKARILYTQRNHPMNNNGCWQYNRLLHFIPFYLVLRLRSGSWVRRSDQFIRVTIFTSTYETQIQKFMYLWVWLDGWVDPTVGLKEFFPPKVSFIFTVEDRKLHITIEFPPFV